VFLGGAVLANLVCLPFSISAQPLLTSTSDRRQGRHVGKQAGVGRAGCARPGQARPAMNGLYLGGSWSALFHFDFLLRIVCKPRCPCLFLLSSSFDSTSPLSIYSRQSGFLSLFLSPTLCLYWSGADGYGAFKTEKNEIFFSTFAASWFRRLSTPEGAS